MTILLRSAAIQSISQAFFDIFRITKCIKVILLESVTDCYYIVCQALQSVTGCSYKVRQVLQSMTDCYYKVCLALQSVAVITE